MWNLLNACLGFLIVNVVGSMEAPSKAFLLFSCSLIG